MGGDTDAKCLRSRSTAPGRSSVTRKTHSDNQLLSIPNATWNTTVEPKNGV
ncbi:unnamed protein product [Cylicostephanus goldi]|uniref:Uncharacterized protein n=1 Tax=Cylicostephanus goldi TaxID=71465 RepID=A0A3P6SUE2_CYLGO|nr:unnamed protein product [Cylicostephanus goldi]